MDNLAEEWRPVKGREGKNEVSNLGRVRSKRKILKTLSHTGGYRMVSLDGRHGRTIHSLVAEAFIGPRPGGYDVNHIDGDKTNNRADNLEYVTRKDNMKHARETGLWDNRGENNGRATCTNEQVKAAYDLVAAGAQHREAAAKIGIPRHVVSAAASGRHWGFPPIKRRSGSVRWTDEQIDRCVELRRQGLSCPKISKLTGVPEETVRRHSNKRLATA